MAGQTDTKSAVLPDGIRAGASLYGREVAKMRNADSPHTKYSAATMPMTTSGGEGKRPKSQLFFDDVAGALAVAVQQKGKHEKPRATGQDRKDDEKCQDYSRQSRR